MDVYHRSFFNSVLEGDVDVKIYNVPSIITQSKVIAGEVFKYTRANFH